MTFLARACLAALAAAGVVACGGASSAPSSSAAVTTTTPSSTATANGNDAYPTVAALAGLYSGTWTNTTFGSSGTIKWTVMANASARSVTIVINVTGNVFGGQAPAPESITLTHLNQGVIKGTSSGFGSVDGTVQPDGSINVTLTNIPGGRVTTVTISGMLSPPSISLAYAVTLSSGGHASGTVTMMRQ